MRSSVSCTSATTSRPSTTSCVPFGMRNATWSTERFSVVLIRSPRNIASVRSGRPDSSASCEQEAQRLVGDAVLRVVEVDPGALGDEPVAARRILGEEIAQVEVTDLGVVPLERAPGSTFAQWSHRATTLRATSVTSSGVKPNLALSSLSGAEAPKVCIATIAPPSPT